MHTRLFKNPDKQAPVADLSWHRKIILSLSTFARKRGTDSSVILDLEKGLCVGLSICHGAFDKIGYLDWWEAALKLVADWDGLLSSLNQTMLLPQATEEMQLSDLFAKVLDYVYMTQIPGPDSTFVLKTEDDKILSQRKSIIHNQTNVVFVGAAVI